jgi:hypothetical protein
MLRDIRMPSLARTNALSAALAQAEYAMPIAAMAIEPVEELTALVLSASALSCFPQC